MQAAFREGASGPEYTTAAARLAPELLISSSGCSGYSRWNLPVIRPPARMTYRVLRRSQLEFQVPRGLRNLAKYLNTQTRSGILIT